MSQIPSRDNVRQKLLAFLAGTITRKGASSWAHEWVAADIPIVEDDVVWQALVRLGGADLMASPDDYLYFESDFHSWLDDIENAIDSEWRDPLISVH